MLFRSRLAAAAGAARHLGTLAEVTDALRVADVPTAAEVMP